MSKVKSSSKQRIVADILVAPQSERGALLAQLEEALGAIPGTVVITTTTSSDPSIDQVVVSWREA